MLRYEGEWEPSAHLRYVYYSADEKMILKQKWTRTIIKYGWHWPRKEQDSEWREVEVWD